MYGNHFKWSELITTSQNLDNSPTSDEHLANLANLWQALNFLREEFGHPIIINSAYRTEAVNKAVGGARKSFHLQGRAADIRPKDAYRLEQLYKLICSQKKKYNSFNEVIKYETFIHVSI